MKIASLILNYHNYLIYLWRKLKKQAQIEYYGCCIPLLWKFMDSALSLSDEWESMLKKLYKKYMASRVLKLTKLLVRGNKKSRLRLNTITTVCDSQLEH